MTLYNSVVPHISTALVRCDATNKRQRVHVNRLFPCAVETKSTPSTEPQPTPTMTSRDAAASPTTNVPSVTKTRAGRTIRTPARYYFRQRGYVFAGFCLFVCLFVCLSVCVLAT